MNGGSEEEREIRRLSYLGISYHSSFKRTGDLADIREAISVQQAVVKLTPDGHADLPGSLSNLGASYHSRFEHTGDLADLVEAISVQQRAVQLMPEDHEFLFSMLNNLAISYQSHFEHTRDLADITHAISVQQRAVQVVPEDHMSYLPDTLNNLAASYDARFTHTGDLADLVEAISVQQRAVQLMPEGHEDLPRMLDNLGMLYHSHFKSTGDIAKLTDAILAQRKVIELMREGRTELPGLLTNLGTLCRSRFDRTGDLADIMEAISVQQRAVQLTPEGHADLPGQLSNLGISYHSRFKQTKDVNDLNASLLNLRLAATSSFGPPQKRLDASLYWAGVSNLHTPLSPDVLAPFETVVRLLALVAGLERTVSGRYTQLQYTSGVASQGAAAACRVQRPDKAVEWLEQGRCLVWSQLNNLRTSFDILQEHNAELAEQLADVSKRLESAASSQATYSTIGMAERILAHDAVRSHLNLAREWDNLLLTVRSIPGFESFLQPSPCSILLQHLPESGSVVVINVSKDRCDAIALSATSKEPLNIPLPNFSWEKANNYQSNLNSLLQSKDIRMREAEVGADGESSERALKHYKKPAAVTMTIRDVLRGLWIEVAKPVLDMLKYSVSTAFYSPVQF